MVAMVALVSIPALFAVDRPGTDHVGVETGFF